MVISWKSVEIGSLRFRQMLVAWLLLWAMCGLSLQAARCPNSSAPSFIGSDRVLREINDPHGGERWLLLPNVADPAGPAQWIRSVEIGCSSGRRKEIKEEIVIHRGDRVVVEEHSEIIAAWLEATALEPAAIGSRLKVRLKIGGGVLKAVATAAGRAKVER